MADFRTAIAKSLSEALKGQLTGKEVLELIEVPPQKEMGDYSFPAFKLAAKMKKSPKEIAEQIAKSIKLPPEIKEVKLAGPYVNFFVNEEVLAAGTLEKILKEKKNFGRKKASRDKIIIEYCQANTHKDFHIGHVRNICLGESIARIFEAEGEKVIRMNYEGDVGPHVSKCLWAYMNQFKGKEPKVNKGRWLGQVYAYGAKQVKENEDLEETMRKMVIQLERGDKKLNELWKKTRKWSLDYFESIYRQLGIKFDVYAFESQMEKRGIEIANQLHKTGFCHRDDGALLVDLNEYGLNKFIILKRDGAALYSTKDLANAEYKFKKLKAKRTIVLTGSEQKFYFQQLIKTIELLNEGRQQYCETTHAPYELVMLKEGKMSSRDGIVVSYTDLYEKAFEKAMQEVKARHKEWGAKKSEETAKHIALAAIKFGMLHQDKNQTIHFGIEDSLKMAGETGPFVQYSYARARSILRKAGKTGKKADFSLLADESEKNLISLLAGFPEVIEESKNILSAHKLTHYLIDVASSFNTFYHKQPVLQSGKELKGARLDLVEATTIVLNNGLELLNIKALEEM